MAKGRWGAYVLGAVECLAAVCTVGLGVGGLLVRGVTPDEDCVVGVTFLVAGAAMLAAAALLLAHRVARHASIVRARVVAMAAQVLLVPIAVVMLERAGARRHGVMDMTGAAVAGVAVFGAVLLALSTGALLYTRRLSDRAAR